MSKPMHTPGPWSLTGPRFAGYDVHAGVVSGKFNIENRVASVDARSSANETSANARLIAAAPDLLEACERALATGIFLGVLVEQSLRDAIDKVKGGE
jgi:hypothetical protein